MAATVFQFDLADVRPRDRAEAWTTVVRDRFLSLDLDAARLDTQDRIVGLADGSLLTARVVAGRQDVVRTQKAARGDGLDYVFANLQLSGTCHAEQGDRRVKLRPGSLALFDGARPYRLCFEDRFEQYVLRMPRAFLSTAADTLDGISACHVAPTTALGRLAVQAARSLADDPDGLAAQQGDLAHTVLRMALADLRGRSAGASSRASARKTTYARARAVLEREATDPDLAPQTLADRLHCSLRHLQAAFAEEGTQVAQAIWSARLDAAERLLTRRPDLSVQFISDLCGFATPSHFSRRFAARHGTSPAKWRRSMQAR